VTLLAPLQRVINTAARIVLDIRPGGHVIPALRDLHWLPVTARIKYKLCLLVHKATVGRFSLAEVERSLSYNNNDRLTAFDPGQPG